MRSTHSSNQRIIFERDSMAILTLLMTAILYINRQITYIKDRQKAIQAC